MTVQNTSAKVRETGSPHDLRAETRVNRVTRTIRERIATRQLTRGARLPSIRHCAENLGVSKSTVVEAYDRLVAEGMITARRGSGFFVTASTPPLSVAEIGPKLDREVDPFWVSRQSLESGLDIIKPGCGWLPPDWLPEVALRRALRTLARGNAANLMEYSTPLGLPALRDLLARRMQGHGIPASPDQIILTDSGTQAIDMLCRILLSPGDSVIVDDPCYFNFIALARAHQTNIHAVPLTKDGSDIETFEQIVRAHKPRLYITNSGLQNPTGASISPVVAHRILKVAEANDLVVIEDDIFADFEHTPAPRLAAFDGLDRVIHIGSFSKTLSASVRCGFIAARTDWIERLVNMKIATTFGGNRLAAEIVHILLSDGSYRKHMDGLKARLAQHMGDVRAKLEKLGITPWHMPNGGIFIWAELPDQIDAARIARHALKDGVILAPGNVFSHSQTATHFMRFNVAQSGNPHIFEVLATALDKHRK